jgi:hypothetical protein
MTITAYLPISHQALPIAFSQPQIWRVMPQAGDAHGVKVCLSNGYQLQFDEASVQVRVINTAAQPPEITTLPDDLPRDGREGAGPLRLVLDDGTKITLQISPDRGDRQMRIEGLVVTQGDQSLIVDGLGARNGSPPRYLPGQNGQALDRLLGNGMPTLRESAHSGGWRADAAGCASGGSTRPSVPDCASGPSLPDLRRQLQSLYCGGCEPAGSVHGKHGYGKHGYGKHGCDLGAPATGKHGYGKHGYGKHGCDSVSLYSGCDPITVSHGKHAVDVGAAHGKHGAYGKHGSYGKHQVGC